MPNAQVLDPVVVEDPPRAALRQGSVPLAEAATFLGLAERDLVTRWRLRRLGFVTHEGEERVRLSDLLAYRRRLEMLQQHAERSPLQQSLAASRADPAHWDES